ncbi:hypothetical protein P9112_013039 [Eukaryota sp. TZLM1-RC]
MLNTIPPNIPNFSFPKTPPNNMPQTICYCGYNTIAQPFVKSLSARRINSDALLSFGSDYEKVGASVFVLEEMDFLDVDL